MARIKRAQIRSTRKPNLFKRSKGFFMARRMWIVRISAALMTTDLSYSRFIHGLNLAGIDINRKMLSELAIHDRPAFDSIVAQARQALA